MKRSPHLWVIPAAFVVLMAACSPTPSEPSPESDAPNAHYPEPPAPEPPAIDPVNTWAPTEGPFEEPPQVSSKNGQLILSLTAQERVVEVGGSPVEGRVYNGSFIGPTMHLNPGDLLTLELNNEMSQWTNIHFHGLHVSPSGDSDNIFRHIDPGKSANYRVQIPPNHETGTFWYHSHAHGVSSGQVFGGLSGLIIIEGLKDRLPDGYQDITERQITLREVYTTQEAPDQIAIERDIGGTSQQPAPVPNPNSVPDPAGGPQRLINGVMMPDLEIAPGETQMWHIGNIGANTFYKLAVDDVTFTVLAEDGDPVWEIWEADHLVLPPGKRYDVLVTGPDAGTTRTIHTQRYMQGTTPANSLEVFPAPIGTLTSSGDEHEALPPLPEGIVETETHDLSDAVIARERTFVFAIPFAPGRSCTHAADCGKQAKVLFTINDKVFDEDRIDAQPELGTVEEWTLVNDSTEQHPFHIHVNDFQVMSINGEPYNAKSLQDTVTIPVGGTVVIRNPFDDFTGKYVFHCHILNHEDGGMMGVVDVVKEQPRVA